MTRSTTIYDSGDVVLVRVVFTDLSGAKIRPAIVLSGRSYARRFGDLIVMPLTSQPQSDGRLVLNQWQKAGLLSAGSVKPLIVSVASSDVVRILGRLDPADDPAVQRALHIVVDARWFA